MTAYQAMVETPKQKAIRGQMETWKTAREIARIAEEYIDKLMAERREKANA